jgi:predicted DCC family thiol-disulfide oxidoreductase YuxK
MTGPMPSPMFSPMKLTVLYDANCSLCTAVRTWLADQPQLVSLEFVPAASPEARRRYPELNHDKTLDEITVVGDNGALYVGEHAWVMCLWATATYRALAVRLSSPAMLPLVRAAAYAAAGLRTSGGTTAGGDYPDLCAGTCRPLPQG